MKIIFWNIQKILDIENWLWQPYFQSYFEFFRTMSWKILQIWIRNVGLKNKKVSKKECRKPQKIWINLLIKTPHSKGQFKYCKTNLCFSMTNGLKIIKPLVKPKRGKTFVETLQKYLSFFCRRQTQLQKRWAFLEHCNKHWGKAMTWKSWIVKSKTI